MPLINGCPLLQVLKNKNQEINGNQKKNKKNPKEFIKIRTKVFCNNIKCVDN